MALGVKDSVAMATPARSAPMPPLSMTGSGGISYHYRIREDICVRGFGHLHLPVAMAIGVGACQRCGIVRWIGRKGAAPGRQTRQRVIKRDFSAGSCVSIWPGANVVVGFTWHSSHFRVFPRVPDNRCLACAPTPLAIVRESPSTPLGGAAESASFASARNWP